MIVPSTRLGLTLREVQMKSALHANYVTELKNTGGTSNMLNHHKLKHSSECLNIPEKLTRHQ